MRLYIFRIVSLQVCVQDFCEELEYWALDDLHLEPCCQHTYYRARYVKMSGVYDTTMTMMMFYNFLLSLGSFYNSANILSRNLTFTLSKKISKWQKTVHTFIFIVIVMSLCPGGCCPRPMTRVRQRRTSAPVAAPAPRGISGTCLRTPITPERPR